jgi:hypothetical protein
MGKDGRVSILNPAGGPSLGGGAPTDAEPDSQVVIVPAGASGGDADESDGDRSTDPTAAVEHPAKVMRIGTMVKQLLEEVRAASLDEEGRKRLRDIHSASISELKDGISPELGDELDRLSLPFGEDRVPSEAELRIAQAQLVGWLEGLFHGIQTALFAQQMAAQAQAQLQGRGRALPPGAEHVGGPLAGIPVEQRAGGAAGTGQYL